MNKLNLLIIAFLLLPSQIIFAQVVIGTSSPNASAQLDVSSTSKGFLTPRMTNSQRSTISSPTEGLLVYQTDAPTGYYFYTGTAWVNIAQLSSKVEGTNFGNSMLIGHNTASAINSANYNLGVGFGTLQSTTTGDDNTEVGYRALFGNQNGSGNTAIGNLSLYNNSNSWSFGYGNTATGNLTLYSNTTGGYNVANGSSSLYSNTSGQFNVAIGTDVLNSNTDGAFNTGVGYEALKTNSNGSSNTAIGARALKTATGDYNVAVGYESRKNCTSGTGNTSCGVSALKLNTDGYTNTALGGSALEANTSGFQNAAVGYSALAAITTGDDNTAIGFGAGQTLTTGNNNVYIGKYAVNTSSGVDNEVVIGNGSNNSYKMYASSWTNACDRNWKHAINDIPIGLDFIKQLRPVEFVYNNANNEEKSLGFIAQEVQHFIVNMNLEKSVDLVTPLSNKYLGLKTTELIAVLTKAVQEQQTMIEHQKHEIEKIKLLFNASAAK